MDNVCKYISISIRRGFRLGNSKAAERVGNKLVGNLILICYLGRLIPLISPWQIRHRPYHSFPDQALLSRSLKETPRKMGGYYAIDLGSAKDATANYGGSQELRLQLAMIEGR